MECRGKTKGKHDTSADDLLADVQVDLARGAANIPAEFPLRMISDT